MVYKILHFPIYIPVRTATKSDIETRNDVFVFSVEIDSENFPNSY